MIKQLSTNKIYIGQTKMKFIKRYWHHVWKLNNNCHDNKFIQNSWNKYGKNDFIFETVELIEDCTKLNIREIYYIEYFDSFKNGFNLTAGGEGKKECPMPEHAKKIIGDKNRKHNLGKKHSEETKLKMRKSSPHRKLSEDHKNKLLKVHLGFKFTDESKEKMSISHRGSKNSTSKIDENMAKRIKEMLINGERVIDVSNKLMIKYHIVRSILTNVVWNHVIVDGWDEFLEQYNSTKKNFLSDDKVREIRKLLSMNYTAVKISEMTNIGTSVIYGIKANRTYLNVK